MSGAFFIGLSGLTNNALGIRNVGNNLANTNTIGYKSTNLFLEELRAAGLNDFAGQGVMANGIQEVWSQGNIQTSQVPTDMAILGGGFFVVGDGSESQFYTRAGNFQVNADGRLTTQNGLFVMGYPAANGEINTTSQLVPLQLNPGQLLPAKATTQFELLSNLNSQTAEGETFSTSTVVYDSLGSSHSLNVTFTRTATGWSYEMSLPAEDVGGLATDPPTVVSSGELAFDSTGTLTTPATNIENIEISGLTNGADDLSLTWNLFDENGGSNITQFDLPSSTSEASQDGHAAGTLSGILVQEDGVIQGLFSNGVTSPIGQLATANFVNPQGLLKMEGNLYAAGTESGEPTIGEPGTGGRGRIAGNSIEMSNVDIAEEFIKLIMFQRGYQANSRVVTTSDQITLEALQMKQ